MSEKKLSEFADVRGQVTDEQIAEMADVSVDEVKAFFDGEPSKPPKPKAAAKKAKEPKAPAKKAKEPEPSKPPKPKAAAKKAKEPKAPRNVRVTRSQRLRGPDGRTLHVRRADVYGGAVATFLWQRHRDLVEPFPPTKA